MSETPNVPPNKLVLELANQKATPDAWEEMKKRVRKWAKKWALRLGGVVVLVGSNVMSYQYGKGTDLSGVWNVVAAVAIAAVVMSVLNRVK
jgi:metal-dependent amidase/aminoacylase/carboxypeptidase family protein